MLMLKFWKRMKPFLSDENMTTRHVSIGEKGKEIVIIKIYLNSLITLKAIKA